MQDLNTMFLFAKVVEHGSYSAAARALGLQTSKLSRRIGQLERQLGVRLIQRTTRKLSVTEIGKSYYLHCAALEAQAVAAQETIDRTRSAPQGTVRLSCPIPLMDGLVSDILARFLVANPLVNVHVEMTNRRVDLVRESIDIALRVRTPPLEPSELAMRRLGDSVGVVVGSPTLLDERGRPAHPADLQRFPTVGMATIGEKHVWHFRQLDGTPTAVTHFPRLMTDSFDALRDAAIAGVGMALLPKLAVEKCVRSGVLERVLPEFSPPPALLHAVFPSRRGMVPAVRALIDALAEGVKRHEQPPAPLERAET
jgi:DNA-binding transcriptional LysR family regulator